MRSITMKVLLAFLVISMVSIVLIVLSIRWMTEREFRTYLFDQNQNNIVTTLADFYGENGTWSGVEESLMVPMELPPPQGNQGGRWFFTLADSSSQVVLAGPGDQVGTLISSADLAEENPSKSGRGDGGDHGGEETSHHRSAHRRGGFFGQDQADLPF